MSVSAASTLASSTDAGSASSRLAALEAKTGRLLSSAELAADTKRVEASAVVTLSDAALGALGTIGKDAVGAVETVVKDAADVVAWPFGVAKDAVEGVAHAVENVASGGWNLVSGAVKAVGSEVASLAKTALDDASSVAGDAVQVAALTGSGGVKLLNAIL